jgi:hypothetical protein
VFLFGTTFSSIYGLNKLVWHLNFKALFVHRKLTT